MLLVDDEPALIDVLEQYLRNDGFAVVRAGDGPTAVALFKKHFPDLVVLDINLPGFPGTEVLRQIRAVRDVPVIMLTARVHEIDRVVGLELGADDYVGKPFSPREVVARVKSVLRRADRSEPQAPAHEKRIGSIVIDTLGHEVHVGGKPATLTPTQFKILDVLVSHVGQTLTRDQLLQRVNADGDVFDRTLDRHIANLRARVEPDPANPRYIVTVFGVGYKMVDPS
ncbi:MAG: two-component system, OmpR family, response regulator RegX3 [Candidatus Eremiobacteraeota bacterium]|nr:two-component system, OmpR family, response regulator RegX3 [Candidatus Eremiobacteraeota bacterium]